MSMHTYTRTIHIMILIIGIVCRAEAGEETEPLTLVKVRELALKNSSKVIEAMKDLENSILDRESAIAAFYPNLSLQGSVGIPYPSLKDSSDSTNPSGSYGFTLSKQLYTGGSRLASLRQTALSITRATINHASVRASVLQTVETLFFDLLEKQDAREVAIKELEAAERSLDTARGKYEVGAVDRVAYLQTQSNYQAKRAAYYQADFAARASKSKLQASLGMPTLGALQLPTSLVPEDLFAGNVEQASLFDSLSPFIETLKSYAREHNPNIQAMEMDIRIQGLSVEVKKASFYPTLSLGWSHTFSGLLKDPGSFSDTGKVTVSATLPLLPFQDKKASVGKEENTKVTLHAKLQDQIRTVESNVEEYVQGIVMALQQIEAAQAAVEFGEENYRQVYEKFTLSRATLAEVSDAESTLSDARAQMLSARYSLYKYWLQLKYLLGFEEDDSFGAFLRQIR